MPEVVGVGESDLGHPEHWSITRWLPGDVEDTWTSSRGWALLIALMTFAYDGESMPRRCADRLVMARATLAG